MKVKFTFTTEIGKLKPEIIVEVYSKDSPRIIGGDGCFIIKEITAYNVVKEDPNLNYDDFFTVFPGYENGVIIEAKRRMYEMAMKLPVVIERWLEKFSSTFLNICLINRCKC